MTNGNATRSIDWRGMTLEQLHGHRFIAVTKNEQMIDGWLRYKSGQKLIEEYLSDVDRLTVIFWRSAYDGKTLLNDGVFKSVEVLDEVRS